MTPGFKYHIVTIAAIFLSLTIGLVVGSLYVEPHLANQQKKVINQIRTVLDRENATQKKTIDQYRTFVAEMMPSLLRGKLAGVPVAIVQTGDYPDATGKAREALQMADARILSVTTIARAFGRPDELLKPALAALQQRDPRFPADREGLARKLAMALAHGDAPTDGFMAALEREDFIDTEPGNDYQTPAQYVVVVAGSRTEGSLRISNVDQPLIAALQKQGLTVVACEPQEALVSDIGAYRSLNIDVATVDNVDTDIGHCTLVFALRGEKDDYGTKETAKRLLPPSLARND